MSDSETDHNSFICDKHVFFVTLLAKHKLLLGSAKSIESRKKRVEAALALANEYNMKLQRKFTVQQIFKKVYNMKGRLKNKNFKNLARTKKLAYTEWERKFLDLWADSASANKSENLLCNPYTSVTGQPESFTSESQNGFVNVVTKSECNIPDDLANIKVETDKYQLQNYSQTAHAPTAIHSSPTPTIWEIESESEQEFQDEENVENDAEFETMPLNELKRIALIAKIKSHNAQRDAAEAQKKAAEVNKELNEYKLRILKRQNGDEMY